MNGPLDNRKDDDWEKNWLKPVTIAIFNVVLVILVICNVIVGFGKVPLIKV